MDNNSSQNTLDLLDRLQRPLIEALHQHTLALQQQTQAVLALAGAVADMAQTDLDDPELPATYLDGSPIG